MDVLNTVFLGNSLRSWITALLVAAIVYVGLRLAKRVFVRRLGRLAKRTSAAADNVAVEVVRQTRPIFMLVIAIWAGSKFIRFSGLRGLTEGAQELTRLPIAGKLDDVLLFAVVVVSVIQAGLWGDAAIRGVLRRRIEARAAENVAVANTIGAVAFLARVALWIVLILIGFQNLGINVGTILAVGGIGGIALALAAQNVLSDLFASASIALDKPFVVGDFIAADSYLGTVEHIGIKTTRVRSLSGEQIVFSNTDLLKSRIRNYKTMQERRIVFSFGVSYRTTSEQLEAVAKIAREAVEHQDKTRFDRGHFKAISPSSLDFEVVYYMVDPDYTLYMDTQQAINLELYQRLADEGIQFAMPRQMNLGDGLAPAADDTRAVHSGATS